MKRQRSHLSFPKLQVGFPLSREYGRRSVSEASQWRSQWGDRPRSTWCKERRSGGQHVSPARAGAWTHTHAHARVDRFYWQWTACIERPCLHCRNDFAAGTVAPKTQLDPAQVQAGAWTLNRSLSTSLFCLLFSIGQENVARARAVSKQVLSYVRPSEFLEAVSPV